MRTAGLAVMMLALSFTSAPAQNRIDLSVSGSAVFSKTVSTSTSSVTLAPRDSSGVFGSIRYHFNHLHAVELNIGHTANSQVFELSPNEYKIRAIVLEYSGAYVLTPWQAKKLQPFLFAGVGALRWTAEGQYINDNAVDFGARNQNSFAFLYGGGADYHLWKPLSLRMQYRGLVFRAPNFDVTDFFISAKGHMAEPSLGLVVKF